MDGSGCAEPNRHVVRSQHCGASIKSVLLCVWGGGRIVFFLRSFCHTDHFSSRRSCRRRRSKTTGPFDHSRATRARNG